MNIINQLGMLQKLMDDEMLFVKEPIDEEIYAQLVHFNNVAHQLFEDAIKAMFKRDYKDAEKIISKRESFSLENELIILMSSKKLDPNVASVLRLIFDSSRRIMDYGRNMAELTLNRTVEELCSTFAFK